MTWKHQVRGIVTKVFPRSLVKSVNKGPNYATDKADIEVIRDPPRWQVQVDLIAFDVGLEQPTIQEGKQVIITIEEVP